MNRDEYNAPKQRRTFLCGAVFRACLVSSARMDFRADFSSGMEKTQECLRISRFYYEVQTKNLTKRCA